MSASVAVRSSLRIPFAGPTFRQIPIGENAPRQCDSLARVAGIRNLLGQEGYNVASLSSVSRQRYGSNSPYFIPPTFLYKLRSGITPHVCQIVALSEITGYRFVDWMRVSGFDLHQIPRLQMRLHTERTVLVTPIEFDPTNDSPNGRYLLAKIGSRDAIVCSQLIPGRVVRVDRWYLQGIRGGGQRAPDPLLLVEHSCGLTCCYVRWINDDHIVLLPRRSPWEGWPLRVPTEARILGSVNMQPQPAKQVQTDAGRLQSRLEPSFPSPNGKERMRFSDLLRISRARTGLTFREAHKLTETIAQILGSRDYAIALGLLSDYEVMSKLPRHIAKIISLCSVYCIDIRELIAIAGVNLNDSVKMPLPRHGHAFEFAPISWPLPESGKRSAHG
jgi:hypothetical protein